MQREKKIPDRPRFDYVTQTAYKFLLECGYTTFPISPFDVLDELKDYVICLPWSEAKRIFKSDDPFHLRKIKAEGRTIRMRDTGMYYIVYDDVNINSPDRISWTIMHEIGHIILGHLVEFDETALNRGGMNGQQYGVLEVEAHYFAAEFLMPTAILRYFNGITVNEIALLFGVSDEAAKKKYKRVFSNSYFPTGEYDNKVVRNFFKFLITGVDEAVYKSIYRTWGIPWKTKYVSVCRKCPECFSYIDDPHAKFCPYCGAEIERKIMYRNLFERMEKQQEFHRIAGRSHLGYPFTRTENNGVSSYETLTVCPVCLNHELSKDAKYCRICGQPLINEGITGKLISRSEDCYSREEGTEATAKSWYPQYEKRIRALMSYRGALYNEDWIDYDYWEFTKFMMRGDNSRASMNLQSATLYTHAFSDDNDDVIIVTDTQAAARAISQEKGVVLSYLKATDDIERTDVEVLVADDL